MKVLQINCVYKFGSTGKIMYDIHKCLLDKGHESVVVYGRGKKVDEPNVYKSSTEIEGKIHSVFSRLFGVDFGYSPIATENLIRIIRKEKPDIVHLQCMNGHFVNVYHLLKFLKSKKINTVLTLHAELMHTAGCAHAYNCEKWKTQCYDCPRIQGYVSKYFRDDAKHCYTLMKNACEGFENLTIVGVSEWVTNRAKQSAIFESAKFKTITNGIDTKVFQLCHSEKTREKLNIPKNKKIILHVTPNFTEKLKGGHYVIELANRMKDYQFVVVGGNSDKVQVPENVKAILHTSNQKELAEYYSMSDCLVMTSSRETFPTVCLEASSCGCSIVGFDVGGVSETIPQGMGEVIEPFDMDAYEKAVRKWADIKASEDYVNKLHFDWSREEMTRKYVEVYKATLYER